MSDSNLDQAAASQPTKPNLRSGKFKDPLTQPSIDKTFKNVKQLQKTDKGTKKQQKLLTQSQNFSTVQELCPLETHANDEPQQLKQRCASLTSLDQLSLLQQAQITDTQSSHQAESLSQSVALQPDTFLPVTLQLDSVSQPVLNTSKEVTAPVQKLCTVFTESTETLLTCVGEQLQSEIIIQNLESIQHEVNAKPTQRSSASALEINQTESVELGQIEIFPSDTANFITCSDNFCQAQVSTVQLLTAPLAAQIDSACEQTVDLDSIEIDQPLTFHLNTIDQQNEQSTQVIINQVELQTVTVEQVHAEILQSLNLQNIQAEIQPILGQEVIEINQVQQHIQPQLVTQQITTQAPTLAQEFVTDQAAAAQAAAAQAAQAAAAQTAADQAAQAAAAQAAQAAAAQTAADQAAQAAAAQAAADQAAAAQIAADQAVAAQAAQAAAAQTAADQATAAQAVANQEAAAAHAAVAQPAINQEQVPALEVTDTLNLPAPLVPINQQQVLHINQALELLQAAEQQAALNYPQFALQQQNPHLPLVVDQNVDLINFNDFEQPQVIPQVQNLPVSTAFQINNPISVASAATVPAQQQQSQLAQSVNDSTSQQFQLNNIQRQAANLSVDNDDEMSSAHILTPDFFSGNRDSCLDPEEWLRQVEHWMRFKNLVDPQKSAAVPVLLRDSALYFYDTLTNNQKTDFEQFKEAFLARYKTNALNGWQDAAAVWNYKQLPGQSVDTYINIMQRKTSKSNMSDEQKRYAIINGLKPTIRKQVLQHTIESIDDIRKWASIVEASEAEESNTDTNTAILKEIQEQIKGIQLRALSPVRPDRTRSASPPRRVHFADEGGQQTFEHQTQQSYSNFQPQQQQNQNFDLRYQTQQPYRQPQSTQFAQSVDPFYQQSSKPFRDPMTTGFPPVRQSYTNTTRFQPPQLQNSWSRKPRNQTNFQPNFQQQQPQITPRYQPQQYQRPPGTPALCYFCGGSWHARTSCPARSIYCSACGTLGHISNVCLKTRNNQ